VDIVLCVSYSHAYESKLLPCEWKLHSACKITLCEWKSYSACRYHTCASPNHSHAYFNHIRACRNHATCRNYTLHVEVTLEHVEITLVSVIFRSIPATLTLVRVESWLCVWKSDFACKNQSCAEVLCWNYILRLQITFCVYKSHSSVSLSHSLVAKLHSCVCGNHTLCAKSHSTSRNFTLRVKITLVIFEITLVVFVITLLLYAWAYRSLKLSVTNFCMSSSQTQINSVAPQKRLKQIQS
jgi:hypothetical protein